MVTINRLDLVWLTDQRLFCSIVCRQGEGPRQVCRFAPPYMSVQEQAEILSSQDNIMSIAVVDFAININIYIVINFGAQTGWQNE